MITQIQLGDIALDVVRKDIKNVHLSVHPPTGRVSVAAPSRMSLDTIRVFAISKIGWIRQQQKKIGGQARETPREYLDRESHFVWGRRYLLKLIEDDAASQVELQHNKLVLRIRPGTKVKAKQAIVSKWYREEIKRVLPELLEQWTSRIGVVVEGVFLQKMKTKWGSCNAANGTIRLNTDLATKPPQCLEYIVVHELVHLREPNHSERFTALMDAHLPPWREVRKLLNDTPLASEFWRY